MEGFTSLLGTIGKDLGSVMGSKGVGGLTSAFGLINQMNQARKEKELVDRSVYYSKHPEAISNLAKSFEKPLDAGLIKGTENVVNASLAEQGLSQAPGIQTQVLAQALAPYQQNSQAMAIQEAFKAIGLPTEALTALQSSMRPDQLALMLKNILPGGEGGGSDIGNILRKYGIAAGGGGPQTTPSIIPDWQIPGGDTSSASSFGSGLLEG